jgi:6-phosphofructokinase 1
LVRRGAQVAVVGVPKTIDNDISWVEKTFGFDTAVEVARQAIMAAHVEAEGAVNGIGLVQLMGRDSGFIAANAAIASREVNFALVPEVPFQLEGPFGLFAALEKRLAQRGHAVVVVAEGAGREHLADAPPGPGGHKMGIGIYLRERITSHFRSRAIELVLKYIDPSYIIRAAAANASDSIFCTTLGHHAVHAALAGKTDLIVGTWNGAFTHVPIPLAVAGRKKISPDSGLWRTVIETTGQPELTAPVG